MKITKTKWFWISSGIILILIALDTVGGLLAFMGALDNKNLTFFDVFVNVAKWEGVIAVPVVLILLAITFFVISDDY